MEREKKLLEMHIFSSFETASPIKKERKLHLKDYKL